MKSTITDRDKGYRSLMKRLSGPQPALRVGVYGDKAQVAHTDPSGKLRETITIGALAEIHEFGLGNVPERSWLRGYVDENNSRITQMLARLAQEVAAGKLTPHEALNLLGLKMVGEIQERLPHLLPPLADSTVKAKGSSATLINTGQFRSSISHDVVEAGES